MRCVFGQHKAHSIGSWRVTGDPRDILLLTFRQVTYLNSVVMPDEPGTDSDEDDEEEGEEDDEGEDDDGESSGPEDESGS